MRRRSEGTWCRRPSFAARRPDPSPAAHWSSLTVEKERTTPGSTSGLVWNPASPLCTPLHQTGSTATQGEPGALVVPKAVGVRGAWLTVSQSGARGRTALRLAQSREAGFSRPSPYPPLLSTNNVRWIAIAPAHSLTDSFLGPIESSSQFPFSLEDVHSLNNGTVLDQ